MHKVNLNAGFYDLHFGSELPVEVVHTKPCVVGVAYCRRLSPVLAQLHI